MLGLAVKELDN